MKKVLTFGVFDYFHLGHLRLFKRCKKYGDYLIVAVQDGRYILKYKPDAKVLYTTEERVEMVESIKYVDKVIIYDAISIETLEKIDFDVLILGGDQKGKRFEDAENWCKLHDKEVVRLERTPGICSSDIKKSLN